jgi:hypothetical protein
VLDFPNLMTIQHPRKIYFKPCITQHRLIRYGFRILKEQWRGGSGLVFLTLTRGEFIYEAVKYETYDWYGIGYCECLEFKIVALAAALLP